MAVVKISKFIKLNIK